MSFAPVPLPAWEPESEPDQFRDEVRTWALSPPVQALADACGWTIDEGAPPAEAVAALARRTEAWDFRQQKERDQIADGEVVIDGRRIERELVLDAATALGLVRGMPIGVDEVDHVLVLSGLVRACVNRCRLAAELLEGAVRAQRVTVLGAERELSTGERQLAAELDLPSVTSEAAVLRAVAEKAFSLGQPRLEDRHDDTPWASWIWTSWPTSSAGVPIDLVVAPSSQPDRHRANTADQLAFWHGRTPVRRLERVLVITSQIYVPYQYLETIRSIGRQRRCTIAIAGVDAERAALPMRDFGPRDYLQEIRSALRSATLVLAEF